MFIINGQFIGFNNHVNYINIFYDKELQISKLYKLHVFIFIQCGSYIKFNTIHFNTF